MLRGIADAIVGGRTDYANLEAAGPRRAALRAAGRSTTSPSATASRCASRTRRDSTIPNLLIVLAAATLGATRLIDNVDVVKQDGKD